MFAEKTHHRLQRPERETDRPNQTTLKNHEAHQKEIVKKPICQGQKQSGNEKKRGTQRGGRAATSANVKPKAKVGGF